LGGLTPEAEVLLKSGRRCCICFGLNADMECKRGQIAHLDQNPQNDNVDNLAFLCLQHHDEYDTRTSQSKGWTVREAKEYRAMLYAAIGELRTGKRLVETSRQQSQPPIFGRFYRSTNKIMDAVDVNTGEVHYGVDAYSLLYGAEFTFEVSNPNRLDMRIVRLYVDVLKFIDVEVIGVWQGDKGGGMRVREFSCEIEPSVGSYGCRQVSDDFDYIRLSLGELEVIRIYLEAVKEGIYRLRLGMDYSVGGTTSRVEVDDQIQEIGVFDPVFHEPSYDWDKRIVEQSTLIRPGR
jgi:hypothetical protein